MAARPHADGNQVAARERLIDMTTARRSLFVPILMLLALVAAACGDSDETISAGGSTDAPIGLDGREFWSVDVTENGATRLLVDGTRITLRFSGDSVGASAGCNSMGGQFTLDGGMLVVDGMGSTEMGCDPARHAQDEFVATVLTQRPAMTLDGDSLILATETVTIELLDREVANPDRPILGTSWVVTGFIDGQSASSYAVETAGWFVFTDESTMNGYDGCNAFGRNVEVSDGSTGGPISGDAEFQFGSITGEEEELCTDLTASYVAAYRALFDTGDATAKIEGDNLTIVNGNGVGITAKANDGPLPDEDAGAAPSAPGGGDLEGEALVAALNLRQFIAESIVENGEPRPIASGTRIAFQLREDEISINAGCNRLSGPIEFDGIHLVLASLAATVMGCEDEREDQDAFIEEFMWGAPAVSIDGGRMVLATDAVTISFVEEIPADPAEE